MRKKAAVLVLVALAIATGTVAQTATKGGTWIASVRLQVEATDANAGDPHVRLILSEAVGKAGVPMSETGGANASVSLTMSPAKAREMADALNAWADDPQEGTIFVLAR